MYAGCFGIYKQEDIKKVIEFLKSSEIAYSLGDPLSLFEHNEVKYHLTELNKVINKDGNLVKVTDELIKDIAQSVGDENYIDNEFLQSLIEQELETRSYQYKNRTTFINCKLPYAVKNTLSAGDLVDFPNGAGEDVKLTEWLDQNQAPFKLTHIDRDKCVVHIENYSDEIAISLVDVFQNIGF